MTATVNLNAVVACLSPSVRACYRCIVERWRARPAGTDAVVITFDQFSEAGARRGSVPASIDLLVSFGLIARAGFQKRPHGHPAAAYRLLVDVQDRRVAA